MTEKSFNDSQDSNGTGIVCGEADTVQMKMAS